MVLQESQFRKTVEEFFTRHRGKRSLDYIADTSTTSRGTVTNLLYGKADTGLYNTYQILKASGQSFVSLGLALDQEEARQSTASNGSKVQDSAWGTSYDTSSSRRSLSHSSSMELGEAQKEALGIIAQAGDTQTARNILDYRDRQTEKAILVNQSLREILDNAEE